MSYSSATGPQACQSADTLQDKATTSWAALGRARPRDGVMTPSACCWQGCTQNSPVWVPAPCSGETRRNQRLLRWSALDLALAIVLPGNKQQTSVILGFDMQSLPCKNHDIFGKTSVWLLGTLQKQAEYSESPANHNLNFSLAK